MCLSAHPPTQRKEKLIIINLNCEGFNKPFRALVDSGASNCFINKKHVKEDLQNNKNDPQLKVRLANGTILQTIMQNNFELQY